MEQLTQKEPHVAKLRIKSPKGYEGGGGVLYLGLAYDSSTGRSGGGGPSSSTSTNGMSAGSTSASAAVGVPSGVLLTNPARNGVTGPSGGGAYVAARSATGAGGGGALPPLPEMREEEWSSAAGSAMGGSMIRAPGPDGDAGAFSMVRRTHARSACIEIVSN